MAAKERILEPDGPGILGVDVGGGGGGDASVIYKRRGPVARNVYRSTRDDTMQLAGKISELVEEDRNVTYQAMAAPWRQFWQNQWGQKADETDALFTTMLKNNDAVLNGQLLIEAGLDRGIGKVVNTMNASALRQASGNVRRAV